MTARVTAKKTAAKRPKATPPAAPVAGSDGFEVLRLTSTPKTDEERVPVFYIDNTMYSIPKRPRMNIALQFMHLARSQGDSQAMDYLLGKLLGEDGYRALREYDDLTPDQFTQITEIATNLTLGALELPKG